MNFDNGNENNNLGRDEKMRLRAITSSGVNDSLALNEPLALMDCGEFSLLISSKDIVTLMSSQKIINNGVENTHAEVKNMCGEVEFDMKKIPVFAFNKALQLQTTNSSQQLTLVVLQDQTHLFAICCAALEKIEKQDVYFFNVPINMSSRKQPFTQFAVINNRAAGFTSASELSRLLVARGFMFPAASLKTIQEAS